jgi:hypothetical protein
MPIRGDCPKDSERLVNAPDGTVLSEDPFVKVVKGWTKTPERPVYGYTLDQAVVNLAMAADDALSILMSMYPAKDGNYVEPVMRLKRALEALDNGE